MGVKKLRLRNHAIRGPGLKRHCMECIVPSMTTVSITELKSNLSRYLREVRRGGEIEVTRRGTPVARITAPNTNHDKTREALIKAGLLTPGKRCPKEAARQLLSKPPIKLHASLSEALIEDREDRV